MSAALGRPEAVLLLPDSAALADLQAYVSRAKRLDADGAARLVGHADVLAVYVSPVHGGGGPTVLGLRTLALARASDVDVTVPLGALTDRFARLDAGDLALAVPPAPAQNASWAGVSPPRRGWEPVGLLTPEHLQDAARAGIAEVAAGTPAVAGAAAVAQLRAGVWGRPLSADLEAVPAGVAFAAEALGFLQAGEPAALYRCGPWSRLTTSTGHVLARRALLL